MLNARVKHNEIAINLVTIDPKAAKKMLEGNHNNRNLNKKTVQKYASAIERGDWQLNGETIKLSENGRLLDGQHRLQAVIEASRPIKTYVAYNIDEDSFKTIDVGKKRAGSDALKIHGCEKYLTLKAASLRIIHCLLNGSGTSLTMSHAITNTEIIELYESLEDCDYELNRAGKLKNAISLFGPGPVGAMFYIFGDISPLDRDKFFHKLNTGTSLEEGDPVLTLRSKIIRDKASGEKHRSAASLPLMICAWNASREGKRLTRLMPKNNYKLSDIG